MKSGKTSRFLRFALCALMIAALTFGFSGCSGENSSAEDVSATVQEFELSVTKADGTVEVVTVPVTDETVGASLLAAGIVDGENTEYGLYIKTVLGETHDYGRDGTYWAFYIDGAYATTGVNKTRVEAGRQYELKAE